MKTHLNQKEWIELPEDLRSILKIKLGIGSDGLSSREVVNGKLVSDGVNENHLIYTTNIGSLLGFLGERAQKFITVPLEDLHQELFNEVINKLDDKEEPKKDVVKVSVEKPIQRNNGRSSSKVRQKKG